MSNQKRLSHPMTSCTIFDIIEKLSQNIAPGSTYGQFYYSTSIPFIDSVTKEEKNILTKLCGYSSALTALAENNIYMVSGKILAPNSKTTPVFHYEAEKIINLGETDSFKAEVAGKSSVVGFGVVVSKKEQIQEMDSGSNPYRNLHVILQHTDYDPVAKAQVQFRAQYIISGRKNLANTFGLFQIGREVLISGHITGYDQDQYMWIVNALSVSIASGHQNVVAHSPSTNAKPGAMKRRPGLISLEENNASAKGTTGSVPSMTKTKSISGAEANDTGACPEPVIDPGAVLSPGSYYKSLASTPSKKRTKKEILADAKKAKANLP
ncbi:hypothetical protein PGT21_001915 [Puccinia graminis f. sp. tritici]|uniref:Uncharacterized protein n=1 Tax=Puccinia graminis f. sp. tritici TaxID=56615 RepID=A0A5B0NDA9_PUCGR|nr:hypothetical protein PGT21_001915 [Puccinia graminis f. sp. tritici]